MKDLYLQGNDKSIVYLGAHSNKIVTGGQRYNREILSYLRRNGWHVKEILLPYLSSIPLIARHLYDNIVLVRLVLPHLRGRTIVLENAYWHARAILLNTILRTQKQVLTIAICHHLTYHDLLLPRYRIADKMISKFSMRLFDQIVAVSRSTKCDLLQLGIHEDRIHVILNALSTGPHMPKVHFKGDWPIRLLFVGPCEQRKGLKYLIQAILLLSDCSVQLDIVGDLKGDPGYVAKLHELVKTYKLQDIVSFHGWVSQDRLWKFYKDADIFVLPSLWEGFGVVLMEAMAFALPVVATNVGGVSEVIRDGYNGLMVPPRDSHLLAEALRRLCHENSLRLLMSKNNQVQAVQFLSWDDVGQAFSSLLAQFWGTLR